MSKTEMKPQRRMPELHRFVSNVNNLFAESENTSSENTFRFLEVFTGLTRDMTHV